MKYLSLLIVLFLFVGCTEQMNHRTQAAYDECLKRNWVPTYKHNGAVTAFDCLPIEVATIKAKNACPDKADSKSFITVSVKENQDKLKEMSKDAEAMIEKVKTEVNEELSYDERINQ